MKRDVVRRVEEDVPTIKMSEEARQRVLADVERNVTRKRVKVRPIAQGATPPIRNPQPSRPSTLPPLPRPSRALSFPDLVDSSAPTASSSEPRIEAPRTTQSVTRVKIARLAADAEHARVQGTPAEPAPAQAAPAQLVRARPAHEESDASGFDAVTELIAPRIADARRSFQPRRGLLARMARDPLPVILVVLVACSIALVVFAARTDGTLKF